MSRGRRLVALVPSLVMARRNVSRARVRSALAAGAILIGVVAIGVIGGGGAAFKESQLNRVEAQGATNVFVLPGPDAEPRSFDRTDLIEIRETVGGAGVVATRGGSAEFVVRPGERDAVSITYLDDPRALYDVDAGSVPRNWRRSAVLSAEFAAERDLRPGDRIALVRSTDAGSETRYYRVTAVLAPTEAFGVDDVFLPFEEAGSERYGQVRVTTRSVDAAEAAAERLRTRFNDREDRLLVFELTSLVRLLKTIATGINVFLTGLGAISLLVAGVSIANTMLMSVVERREEIGVLRSVGYTKGDVVRILLAEAALIGGAGAVVGLVLATAVVAVANLLFLGDPLAFSPVAVGYLLGGAGFGVLTSLVAGVYPAWRAANERPVDALRG